MQTFPFLAALLCALAFAGFGARWLVRRSHGRSRTLDHTDDHLRKVHAVPTPRVGGIAVALGIGGAFTILWLGGAGGATWVLLLCVLPGFVGGLIEDVAKHGAVFPRLILPAVAGALGYWLLDARITELAVPGLDYLLTLPAFALLGTIICVTGVTHALNVVDGLNGLAGVTAFLAALGLAVVAAIVGDGFVLAVAGVLAASLAGFLLVNYPSGRIFLGDGGAYLVGLLLAELSVLIVHRNPQVSPWFPLMLLAYPIWETLFSIYRRKMRGHGTAHADALHLHQLVYRRLVRGRGGVQGPDGTVLRNSVASLLMWLMPLLCFAAAVALWNNTIVLQLIAWIFALLYCRVYFRLVRFRVPTRAVVRLPARADVADEDLADAVQPGR